mmetsp:Transcript_29147/g.38333  ORF Transcript_29147/g.38333 Transcript_29147/m.38333 type:complete len:333 (+) Transcript_29147:249-1247(+)
MSGLAILSHIFVGIINDAKMIYKDPALGSFLEIFFCYPGFWALFWYRFSHAMYLCSIPLLPRFIMALVRFCTAVDIHPAAKISKDGILLDHATGIVIGSTASIGGHTTIYHQVTLGATGKPVPKGERRHPIVGSNCLIGAGAKILGAINVGNGCLVGANSVLMKSVPDNCTAAGIPARIIPQKKDAPKKVAQKKEEKPQQRPETTPEYPVNVDPYTHDLTAGAICVLHRRLSLLEEGSVRITSQKEKGEEGQNPAAAAHWRRLNTLMAATGQFSAAGKKRTCARLKCLKQLLHSIDLTDSAYEENSDSDIEVELGQHLPHTATDADVKLKHT